MKIILIDQPIRNRGDESAHKALLRRLAAEQPVEKITVPYRYPEADMRPFMVDDPKVEYVHTPEDLAYYRSRIYGVKRGWKWMWHLDPAILRLVTLYRQADYVVSSPGGINLGGFRDWHHLFFLELARYLGKPIMYFGRSIGPFPETDPDRKLFHEKAESILDYMSFISLRDSESEKYIGGRNHVMTLDSAFLEVPSAAVPAEVADFVGESPYMVFVPNSLVWHYRYREIGLDRVRSFYRRVLEGVRNRFPDHKVVMLPQLYNGPSWIENDRLFFNEIASEGDFVAPDTYSSDEQQAIIRGASFVIGARYHSVVFALNNAVPFVALSYEHKMSGLADALGKSDRIVDITGTFSSEETESETVASIMSKLETLEKDPVAAAAAARIADNGYKAFLKAMEPLVSVIVPNYNHAPYLDERLKSILSQTYRNIELIILDDCSTDGSLEIARKYSDRAEIIVNEVNSGSPFKQWMKGIEAAKGEFVWIAESDDSASPDFLERVVQGLTSRSSVLSFSRSMEIDSEGNELGIQRYQQEMTKSFDIDGRLFIMKYLARRNTVANASAAVFRRDAALAADRSFMDFSGAGDTLFWTSIAEKGRVSFVAEPLNHFRQHGSNRTAEDALNGKGLHEALRVYEDLYRRGYISRLGMLKIRTDNIYRIMHSAASPDRKSAAIKEWKGNPLIFFLVMAKGIKRRKG